MNTHSSLTLRSWQKLLIFEALGGSLSLMLGLALARVLPFWTPEIADAARPYLAWGLLAVWLFLSLLGLKSVASGISVNLQFALSAMVASPLAAAIFTFLFEHRHRGLSVFETIGLTTCFAAMTAGLSLFMGLYAVEAAKLLGKTLARWKASIGLAP